jgi:hypothetical protein
MSKNCPDESWGVGRLGKFCSTTRKKMAIDAWRFGHALNLARAKQDHGQWKEWKEKYVPGLSHTSENRYRRLAEELTEDSLDGKGLTDAYRRLGLTYTGKDRGRESLGEPGENGPTISKPVGFAADDVEVGDGLGILPEVPAFQGQPQAIGVIETEGRQEGASPPRIGPRAEPPADEPYRIRLQEARQNLVAIQNWVGWLRNQTKKTRQACWKKHGLVDIAQDIDRTVQGLTWLAADLTK